MFTDKRRGFSLIELMTAIGIIAVLVSLLLPAVQYSREAARKVSCNSNIKQIMLGCANYESTYGVLPAGITHKYQILPFIEKGEIYDQIDHDAPEPALMWVKVQGTLIPLYQCPTDPEKGLFEDENELSVASTSYLACAGTGILTDGFNGVFGYTQSPLPDIYPDSYIKSTDIKDGTSSTIALSETLKPGTSVSRLRNLWVSPTEYTNKEDMPAFQDFCESIPPIPEDYGYLGATSSKGAPWYGGGMGTALYNHALPPNYPSCLNGTITLTGIYTATSMHLGGVYVVYADGHTSFITNSIDRKVWHDLGSRSAGLYQPPF